MKLRFRIIVLATLAVAVLGFMPIAQAVEDSSSSTNTNTSGETEESETTLEERINKANTRFTAGLTAAEQALIKDKCVAAQAIVKKLGSNVNANVPARIKAYQNLHDKLSNLVSGLKDKGIDTTVLEQELTVLDQEIATFKTDLATYKQVLSDLKDIDCKSDPEGFKLVLEAARADREQVGKDIADIKTYVKETIKPTLQQIRDQLKTQESNE